MATAEAVRALPGARRAKQRRHGDGRAAALFLAPGLGGFTIFTLIPIMGSLLVAFTVWPLTGNPSFTGLSNFKKLFTDDPLFLQSLRNTLVFTAAYVPLNIAISLGMAAWISPRIRGRNAYRVLFFIPVVTPIVANAAVWQLILMPNGAVDSVWQTLFGGHSPNFLGDTTYAMASVVTMSLWQGFGYNLLVFATAMEAVPESLLEAARLDGAGPIRQFFSVKIPLISPALFFATTMTVIASFQVFAQPYVLTNGGPNNRTTTLVMYLYRNGFQFYNLGYAAAVGVVLFVVILLVSGIIFALQRRLVHYE
jgi:multiple sugar transport system permease protein